MASDKILIEIPQFTLLQNSEILQGNNEPYIISVVTSYTSSGLVRLCVNHIQYERIRKNQRITFPESGFALFGPTSPDEIYNLHVRFMEADQDARKVGEIINRVVEDSSLTGIASKILAGVPSPAGILFDVGREIMKLIGTALQANQDDLLYEYQTGLLKDDVTNFINKNFVDDIKDNDWISSGVVFRQYGDEPILQRYRVKNIKLENMPEHPAFNNPLTGLKTLKASIKEPLASRIEVASQRSTDSRVLAASLQDLPSEANV